MLAGMAHCKVKVRRKLRVNAVQGFPCCNPVAEFFQQQHTGALVDGGPRQAGNAGQGDIVDIHHQAAVGGDNVVSEIAEGKGFRLLSLGVDNVLHFGEGAA